MTSHWIRFIYLPTDSTFFGFTRVLSELRSYPSFFYARWYLLALNAVHLSVISMMSRTVAKEFGRKEALILAKNLRVTGTSLNAMCIISGTLHGVCDCQPECSATGSVTARVNLKSLLRVTVLRTRPRPRVVRWLLSLFNAHLSQKKKTACFQPRHRSLRRSRKGSLG